MDDFVKDTVIKIGGKWPFIGAGVAAAAFLGWLTYKVYDSELKPLAFLPGAATLGVVLAVLLGLPASMAECRRLYNEKSLQYSLSNCDVLVHCSDVPRPFGGPCE